MPVGPQETVLASPGARALCIGVAAIAAVVLVSLVVWGRPDILLRALPGLALVVELALVLFWLPRVRVTPAEVEVVNPFRSYRVSWPAIREVGSRWALTLYVPGGRIEAWAAPAPGPLTGGGVPSRSHLQQQAGLGARTERRAPGAADIVHRQWESYREAGLLGAVEGEGVTRRWHPVRIAVTVALFALTVASITLP